MKIAICGSMQFAKEMVDLASKLRTSGHEVELPSSVEEFAKGNKNLENKWAKSEGDVIRGYYEKIKAADAVLVANYAKNGVENYIGGNGLMELAFGYVLGKKIFLLNSIPQMAYTDEIVSMNPVILNGDVNQING